MLDEPTNGLDPQGTREVRALIRSLADDGTTVFVSSHLLAEVEQMCTHVGVMSAGRLVAQGTLDEFRDERRGAGARAHPGCRRGPRRCWRASGSSVGRRSGDGRRRAATRSRARARRRRSPPEAIVAALVAAGVRVRGFEVERASLEQRFVELTGEGFDVVQ